MELESLKIAIDKRQASFPADQSLLITGFKSISLLAKIRDSIRWETGFAIVFGICCLLGIFLSGTLSIAVFSAATLLYSTAFIMYLQRLLRRTNSNIESDLPVKLCIEETISVISSFIKVYQRLAAWFLPLVFLTALPAAWFDQYVRTGGHAEFPVYTLLLSLPIILAWIFVMTRFTRWWLNRFYGKNLLMLKAQLQELSEDR